MMIFASKATRGHDKNKKSALRCGVDCINLGSLHANILAQMKYTVRYLEHLPASVLSHPFSVHNQILTCSKKKKYTRGGVFEL